MGNKMSKPLSPIPNNADYKGTYKVQLTRHLEAKRTKPSLRTKDFREARQICREIDSLRDNPDKIEGISDRAKSIYFGDVYESIIPTSASVDKINGGIIERRIEANKYIHAQNIKIQELEEENKHLKERMAVFEDSNTYKKFKASEVSPTLAEALAYNKMYMKTKAEGTIATTHNPVAKIMLSIESIDESTKVSEIDVDEIQEAVELDSESATGSKNNRYAKMRGLIHGFFNRLNKKFKTPRITLDSKKVDDVKKSWLRQDDIKVLLNHHADRDQKAMAAVFVLAGFRSKGVRLLRCGDVFIDNYENEGFKHPTIQLNPNFSYKTKRSQRAIRINSFLLPLLKAQINIRKPEEPLFPSHLSEVSEFYTKNQFRAVTRALFADVPTKEKVTCLVCRRTFGQSQRRFSAEAKDISQLQAQMGHKDMKTTVEIYSGSESAEVSTELNFDLGPETNL